jgi:hypothetical protein
VTFAVWLERQSLREDNVGWLSEWLFRFGDVDAYPAAPTTFTDWLDLLRFAQAMYGEAEGPRAAARWCELDKAMHRAWQEWRMELNGQPALPYALRSVA